ncbi:MAG: hypothetical protein BWY57_01605 [Betaproteobacteria bacterium ADurb.Bin341]|nr:MAG: hypothetical protein BWY57_01605 [Betaproteobacteria bacterium ADurb.Bin341]
MAGAKDWRLMNGEGETAASDAEANWFMVARMAPGLQRDLMFSNVAARSTYSKSKAA